MSIAFNHDLKLESSHFFDKIGNCVNFTRETSETIEYMTKIRKFIHGKWGTVCLISLVLEFCNQ